MSSGVRPRTEAGRALAAKAKHEGWSNWEGLAQFTIPAIEAEAAQGAARPDAEWQMAAMQLAEWNRTLAAQRAATPPTVEALAEAMHRRLNHPVGGACDVCLDNARRDLASALSRRP